MPVVQAPIPVVPDGPCEVVDGCAEPALIVAMKSDLERLPTCMTHVPAAAARGYTYYLGVTDGLD